MNSEQIEQTIQEKNLSALRVTLDLINAIAEKAERRYWVPEGTTLTVCVLVLETGYTVSGEAACISHENYDKEMGEKIAFERARDKLWGLEGYVMTRTAHDLAVNSD